MMRVGVLEVHLELPGVHSLKEKRSVIKGLLEKIQHRFQVAAAEVEEMDRTDGAGLGFAAVGNEVGVLQSRLQKVVSFIDTSGQGVLVDYRVEILT
ncbi:MAG: DUF503 domain-containing protein [Magnetococcales bacterium]|nr:DUF503 domain-containing protein [Magnetococcales bacterium]MBF0438962.1 DUF503 domain-containing protein [Magnetococcales bacterium]